MFTALFFKQRQRKAACERSFLSIDAFIDRLAVDGGDPEISRMIYLKLMEWGAEEGFSPYPEDGLLEMYGIGEEEVDEDLLLSTMMHFGIPIPDTAMLAAYDKIETVRDVVTYLTTLKLDSRP